MPQNKYRSTSSRHFADPPPLTSRKSYDQFVPSYANESYESYQDMRSGYGGSPARGSDRSPPRAPRDRGFEFTSDRVHPREAKLDSRDSRDRDRGRDRSRSPPRYPSSRPSFDDRRGSYQRPAQQSPRPSPLGNHGASASSPRPPHDIPKLIRHDSSPSIRQTPKDSPSSAPSVPVQSTVTAPSAPTEVNLAISQTLGEIFKQFGEEAANTALLKQQKATAEKEFKRRRDEYSKGKPNHGKFPASEEAQRKAKDHAERQLDAINKKLKDKDESLKDIATSAASKIPNILGTTSGGASSEGHQKMLQNCEDLAKRCNHLQQQLEDQKKQMDDERKARSHLEEKHSELLLQYKTIQSQVGDAKLLQSKFEGDIRSQLKKEAIDVQKEIQELKRSAASTSSDLSRVPPDLQQTLQRFDDFFKRLNGLANFEAELQKIRREVTENSESLNSRFTPLIQGLDQAKRDIAEHTKHIIDTANEQSVFQDKLKDWKKRIDAAVSAASTPSKEEYISKQDFAALKQQVTRIGSEPATPPADLPLNPNILVPLQDLQAKVQTLETQVGSFDLSRVEDRVEKVENRVPAWEERCKTLETNLPPLTNSVQRVESRVAVCEANSKMYTKASSFNEALNEVADIKRAINGMNAKWVDLNKKVDKQHREASKKSPFPDNRAATPASGSRAASASLPINTPKSTELEQRLSEVEAKFPPIHGRKDTIATQEWVKEEIETAHNASDDFLTDKFHLLENRVITDERKIEGIAENVRRIISQNTTVIETTVNKSFSTFEQKHAHNLGLMQQTLQSLQDQLLRQDGGVMIRLDGLASALTHLDSRIAKINTLDLYQSMAHQFHQDQFPQLQNLPNLEVQLQATAERVSALENVAKDPSLSGLRDIQEASETLADKMNALDSRTSNHNTRITTLESRSSKETDAKFQKEMRSEMDRNTHDLSKLNSKMKTDVQTVVPRVVQLEDAVEKVKADLVELRAETGNNKKATKAFKDECVEKIVDLKIELRNPVVSAPSTARSAPSLSPFNMNPNSSIRDRKISTPITNGSAKKRKLENGHSTHPSVSSNPRANGASRGNSIDHSKKSKRRRRNPEEDEDDEDYEEVIQPAVRDSESEEEDD